MTVVGGSATKMRRILGDCGGVSEVYLKRETEAPIPENPKKPGWYKTGKVINR